MSSKTTSQTIAFFGPKQFTGYAGRESHNLFFGTAILTAIVCLILAIFIPLLQNPGIGAIICFITALAVTIRDIASTVQREKRFLAGLTEKVNEFIVESTGDSSSRITARRLRQLIDFGGKLPLAINGVPCLDLTVTGIRFGARQIVATVTAPDYALASFDRLLQEEQRKA